MANKLKSEQKVQAVNLLCEGVSIRAVERITGIHRDTVMRLAENSGFGSDPYCKEELIAEMGAAFLCGQAEIVERTIDGSAAYIKG